MHSALFHPLTGKRIGPVGYRKNGCPIWPVMGGDDTVEPVVETPSAGEEGAPKADEKPFPEGKAVADMTVEEQAAYWKFHAKKHEQRSKTAPSKEEWEAAQAKIAEFEKANLTESEKAIAEAYEKGKAEAAAQAATIGVQALVDARKAYLDETKDADVIESLDLIDYTKFIKDGAVDSVRLTKVLDRLAPVGGGASGNQEKQWPATGQGNQNTGTGSAKDAGKAEAERRFGKAEK